jgi:glyoxylase-like metal-dependent hydrolase (beta-lactamase superfamily II)
MNLKQRRFAATAAAVFAAASMFCASAEAGAPMQKSQAPGYYHMTLGDFEVTALSDGIFSMDASKILIVPAQQLNSALAGSFLKEPVDTSVNGFLINTGSKLVLVDTGAGANFGPTMGRLLSNLKASGYKPDQVDEILITHMHGDHVGGLLADGKPAFPNAVVRASKSEADFWLNKANLDSAPADTKDAYQTAMNDLNPYVAAGRFKSFDGDVELLPGIRALAAAGHTAGHTVYLVESKGEKLVLWGDLMHVASVQFADPSVTIRFDTNSAAAAAQRKKVFADVAAHGSWVAGAHLSFPGLGHLRAAGSGYEFIPANYGVPH